MNKQSDRYDDEREKRQLAAMGALTGGMGGLMLGALPTYGLTTPLWKKYEAKKAAQTAAALKKQRGIFANLSGKHPLMSLAGAGLVGGLGGELLGRIGGY